MSRPIPVFAFLFAAYAIARRDVVSPIGEAERDKRFNPFARESADPTLRRKWPQHGNFADLIVKVAASTGSGRERAGAARARYLWLVDCAATAQGFSGVVAYASADSAEIGARVNFTADAVREWKFRGVGETIAVHFSRSAFASTNKAAGGKPRAIMTHDER